MAEGHGESRRRGPQSKAWRSLFRQQFFKTKLCRFYPRGECRYGTECPYAHDQSELHQTPDLSKTALCEDWQNGCCTKPPGECPFAHGQDELRVTELFEESPLCKRVPGSQSSVPIQPAYTGVRQPQVPNYNQNQRHFVGHTPTPPMGPPPTGAPTRHGAKNMSMSAPIAAMYANPLLVAKGYMPQNSPLDQMASMMPNNGEKQPPAGMKLSNLIPGPAWNTPSQVQYPDRQRPSPQRNVPDYNLGLDSPLPLTKQQDVGVGNPNYQTPLSQASTASQSSIGDWSASQWGFSGSEPSPMVRNPPLGTMPARSAAPPLHGSMAPVMGGWPCEEQVPQEHESSDDELVQDEPAYVIPSPGGGSPNRSPLTSQCSSPKLRARRLRGASESQSPVRGWDRTPSMSPSPRRRAAPAINTPAAATYLHGLLDVFGKRTDEDGAPGAGLGTEDAGSLEHARQQYHKSLQAFHEGDDETGPPFIEGSLPKAVVPVGSPLDEPVMASVPGGLGAVPVRLGGQPSLVSGQQFLSPPYAYPPLQVGAGGPPM